MAQELKIIDQTYELILWLRQKVVLFPRHSKYSFGHRIESRLLDFFESLLEAKYSRDKEETLSQAGLRLEQVRFLIRLAKDTRLISVSSHEYAVKTISEIGRQLQGWRKYASPK